MLKCWTYWRSFTEILQNAEWKEPLCSFACYALDTNKLQGHRRAWDIVSADMCKFEEKADLFRYEVEDLSSFSIKVELASIKPPQLPKNACLSK